MQTNEILKRLKGVKRNGNQYRACCPVHSHGKGNGDKNQSLSIDVQGNKILLNCFAGCPTEDIVGAMGLEMKDLFIEENHEPTYENNKQKREIDVIYDYKDLNGNVVHRTIRYRPKGFSQCRPDPSNPSKWIWKDVFKDIKPIMYNLQAINTAIKEKQPVLIVEGEKDCNNLGDLGFVATTCPMGAGKWQNHYSATLKSGTIYIIADNDPVGNRHSENVAKSIVGKAESIYMVDLLSVMPDLPTGGDISDYIEKIPNEERKAAVEELLANAVPFEIGEEQEEISTGTGSAEKISQSEQLLNMVESMGVQFFHDEIKELYAAIPVDEHTEVFPIDSRDFELWLNGLFYKQLFELDGWRKLMFWAGIVGGILTPLILIAGYFS